MDALTFMAGALIKIESEQLRDSMYSKRTRADPGKTEFDICDMGLVDTGRGVDSPAVIEHPVAAMIVPRQDLWNSMSTAS